MVRPEDDLAGTPDPTAPADLNLDFVVYGIELEVGVIGTSDYKSIIEQYSLRVALKKELNAVVVLEQNCGFSHQWKSQQFHGMLK
ncbi:hypothetical protein AnigIFM60653_001610 [Aspergillus niger]|nr:hypothetical protein AnigIFM60653_001610 [Aspergillus niger]